MSLIDRLSRLKVPCLRLKLGVLIIPFEELEVLTQWLQSDLRKCVTKAAPERAVKRQERAASHFALDLHGKSLRSGIRSFISFYNDHHRTGYRGELTVIHGYGQTGVGGVLRKVVRDLLAMTGVEHRQGESVGTNPGLTYVDVGREIDESAIGRVLRYIPLVQVVTNISEWIGSWIPRKPGSDWDCLQELGNELNNRLARHPSRTWLLPVQFETVGADGKPRRRLWVRDRSRRAIAVVEVHQQLSEPQQIESLLAAIEEARATGFELVEAFVVLFDSVDDFVDRAKGWVSMRFAERVKVYDVCTRRGQRNRVKRRLSD